MKHLLLIREISFTVGFKESTGGRVELVEKADANKAEWQGKEVTVYGYVSQYRPPPEGTDKYLHLTPSPAAVSARPHDLERHVSCMVPNGNTIEPMTGKYITVKGTIAKITSTNYLDQKRIDLEPCELVK